MIEDKIYARVFNLAIRQMSEATDGLFDVYLGAAVCVGHISEASGHRGMPAIDAVVVSAPMAMVLWRVHRFATDLIRCALVGVCQNNAVT